MEDIIIAGYSVQELKKQREAIAKDASKLISEKIQAALDDFPLLRDSETYDEAKVIATRMVENLEAANVVAGVSGVTFYMPFYEEYGEYSYTDTIHGWLDDCDNENIDWSYGDKSDVFARLYSVAEDMETSSRDWHSSRC